MVKKQIFIYPYFIDTITMPVVRTDASFPLAHGLREELHQQMVEYYRRASIFTVLDDIIAPDILLERLHDGENIVSDAERALRGLYLVQNELLACHPASYIKSLPLTFPNSDQGTLGKSWELPVEEYIRTVTNIWDSNLPALSAKHATLIGKDIHVLVDYYQRLLAASVRFTWQDAGDRSFLEKKGFVCLFQGFQPSFLPATVYDNRVIGDITFKSIEFPLDTDSHFNLEEYLITIADKKAAIIVVGKKTSPMLQKRYLGLQLLEEYQQKRNAMEFISQDSGRFFPDRTV